MQHCNKNCCDYNLGPHSKHKCYSENLGFVIGLSCIVLQYCLECIHNVLEWNIIAKAITDFKQAGFPTTVVVWNISGFLLQEISVSFYGIECFIEQFTMFMEVLFHYILLKFFRNISIPICPCPGAAHKYQLINKYWYYADITVPL